MRAALFGCLLVAGAGCLLATPTKAQPFFFSTGNVTNSIVCSYLPTLILPINSSSKYRLATAIIGPPKMQIIARRPSFAAISR